MQNSVAQARKRAIRDVTELIENLGKLKGLNSEINKWEKKLASVETQLVAGVQAELDEMQLAAEIIGTAQAELRSVRENFKSILKLSDVCTKTMPEFESAWKLKNARINLKQVLVQLDMYDAVPLTVKKLEAQMTTSPKSLKLVFLEWLKLQHWKEEILGQVSKEIKTAELREEIAKKEEQTLSYKSSLAAQHRTLKILEDHFEQVNDLGASIWQRLDQILNNFMELALYDPSTLVLALEIVERFEQHLSLQRKQAIVRGESLNSVFESYPICVKRKECLRIVQRKMNSDVESLLRTSSEYLTDIVDIQDESGFVRQFLEPLNKVVAEMSFVHHDVVKCFPPIYSLTSIFRKNIEQRICDLISHLLEKGDLGSGIKLRLLSWIDVYLNEVRTIQLMPYVNSSATSTKNALVRDNSSSLHQLIEHEHLLTERFKDEQQYDDTHIKNLRNIASQLANAYIEQAFSRLMKYVQSILERENEIERTREGTVQTARPEDLFNAVSQEIQILMEYNICGSTFSNITLGTSVAAIKKFQELQLKELEIPIRFEMLCVNINDNSHMYDLCDDSLEKQFFLAVGQDNTHRKIMKDTVDQIASGFARNARLCGIKLVDIIFEDLDATLATLFSNQWLNDLDSPMLTLAHTFKDFFESSQDGLNCLLSSEYQYGRCIASCFERTVCEYIERLILREEPFENVKRCSKRIRDDHFILSGCFEAYGSVMKYGNIYNSDSFNERLRVILLIAEFFENTMPNTLFEHLATEFGAYFVPVVTKLVFLNGKMPRAQKLEVTSHLASSEYATTATPRSNRFALEMLAKSNAKLDWSLQEMAKLSNQHAAKNVHHKADSGSNTDATEKTVLPNPQISKGIQTIRFKDFLQK